MSEVTGTVDFIVGGEKYETWYKVVGDLKSGERPLVLLHGGPGFSHHYMLPHIELYHARGIPVVTYDQIGIGQSTHLPDKPKGFWSMELFEDELENLIKHLGIADNYDLLGHSWGGMLAACFVTDRQPAGVKRLVLVSTLASMDLWVQSVRGLLAGMPQDIIDVINKHEKAGTFDDPEYEKAMMAFLAKHACTLDPWPAELNESLGAMAKDSTVYNTMLGPSEFTITGTLKTWSVLDKLHTIRQPTLIANGVFDEAQDICMSPFFENIEKVKWIQFAKSSHTAWFEERERYFKVVGEFLRGK